MHHYIPFEDKIVSVSGNTPSGFTSRHPPYLQLPLALVFAVMFSDPLLAADFTAPLYLDASTVATFNLDHKQVDVTGPAAALTVQGADYSLRATWLRNGAGPGIAVGGSGHLQAQGLDAATHGSGAPALRVDTQGRVQLSAASSLLTTDGRSPAAMVQDGELHISDSRLKTLGVLSPGTEVGSNALLQVERSQIETLEMTSAGIREIGNSLAGLVSDSQIHTHQAESAGVLVSASNGTLTLSHSSVLTDAGSSTGIWAENDSHVVLDQGSTVHSRGDMADAVSASRNSSIEMSDGQLFSEGARSAAARVGSGSRIDLQGTQVLAVGSQAAALIVDDGAWLSASDSAISNLDGSTAQFTRQRTPGAIGQLQLTRSSLSGPSALIESQAGGQGQVTLKDSQLLGAHASALVAAPGSTLQVTATGSKVDALNLANVQGDGQFQLAATDSLLSGDSRLQAPGNGRLDMQLNNSFWQFHGDSSLSNLTLDHATVFFAGNGFQVLTVNGDLSGNGRFQMKTDLASTRGDLLDVMGQVSGQHELLVADSGKDANGAPLKVVGSRGGAGQFTLYGGHVDAGAFRYDLQRQGSDWYLAEVGQLAPMQALNPSMPPQSVPVPTGVAMTALNPSIPPQSVPVPTGVPMTALNPSTPPQSVPVPTGVPMTALNPSIPPQSVPVPTGVPMTTLNPSMPPQSVPVPTGVPMTALNPSMPAQAVPVPASVPQSTLIPSTPDQASPQAPATLQPPGNTLVPVVTARQPSQPQRLSKGANAALGMQSAAANLWNNEMSTLTRRLGELRQGNDQGGVWTRALGAELKVDSGYSRAFDQRLSGAQIGADGALEQAGGTLYLGGMLGAGHSDQDFGEQSSGKLDSQSIGAYATYLREDGWYVDGVVKYDHLQGDVRITNNVGGRVHGDYSADAYGASVELGRQIALGQGWFVEPQAQLAAAHVQGSKYTSNDGLKVDADAVDSLQARVGGRVGRNLVLDSGTQVQGYMNASWIDELAGDSQVEVNGHGLDNALPGTRGEIGGGASLLLGTRHKISVEADYTNGHDIEQPLAITLGYRYLW